MARRLFPYTDSALVAVCAEAASLPAIPAAGQFGVVPAAWTREGMMVGKFDLLIWADGTANLTSVTFDALIPSALVIADDDVDTVDFANDELDITSHAYTWADGPLQLTTSGTLPAGLELSTDYWVIYKDGGTIQLAASRANALAGTAVAIGDAGSGTHTIVDTADSQRLYSYECSEVAATYGLTDKHGATIPVCHKTAAVAYALKATISANNVWCSMLPVVSP
jgi:hypothetical protein